MKQKRRVIKYISKILVSGALATIFLIGSYFIVDAVVTNQFPAAKNNWVSGQAPGADWPNAIEDKIGIDGDTDPDSLDYKVNSASSSLGSISDIATTTGNLIVGDGTAWVGFTIGTDGKVLKASSTAPNGISWEYITAAGSDGEVQYNSSNLFAGDSDFTWNDATDVLAISGNVGIGTTTPSYALAIGGTSQFHVSSSGIVTAVSYSGDGSNLTGVGSATEVALTISAKAGENITVGNMVYQSGATGQVAQVMKTDNTIDEKSHVMGMAAETKTSGQTILIRTAGEVTSLNTAAWGADGDSLYMTTAGGLSTTTPTTGSIHHIGHITYSHANSGKVQLHHHEPDALATSSSTDIFFRMGDAIGVQKVSFRNYANSEVAYIDSFGNISINGSSTVAGNLIVTNSSTIGGNLEVTTNVKFSNFTDGMLLVDASGNISTATSTKVGCINIENLAAADDDMPIASFPFGVTILRGWGHCVGTCTTNATIDFQDSDGNAMTMTDFTTSDWGTEPTPQPVTGANTLIAYEGFSFNVTNAVDPETDTYQICFSFR